jgi:hypothetical protein
MVKGIEGTNLRKGVFLLALLLLLSLVGGYNCKTEGCSPGERCMADGECSPLTVKEHCEGHGFHYDDALLKINCQQKTPSEKKLLCQQCQGDYGYNKNIADIKGIIYSVAAGIAILLLVVNGYQLLISPDVGARENAKRAILFVILGLILLMGGVSLVGTLFFPSTPPILGDTTTTSTTRGGSDTSTTLFSCMLVSACKECLAQGCEWCEGPTIGYPLCLNDCDIPECEVCLKTSCVTSTTTSTTLSTTTTVPTTAKLTVMFVPVNWIGSLSSFDSAVQAQADEILRNIPLRDCPPSFVIKKAGENCDIGPMSCTCPDLFRIESCAQATGESYDYVIGLNNGDPCISLGFSCHTGTVFCETGVTMVAVHELGHEWGLTDEYCSYMCSGCPNGPPNMLSVDEGCDPTPGGSCCEACVGYAAHCLGNVNSLGGRCMMGRASAPGPRAFCHLCRNHLLTVPVVNC